MKKDISDYGKASIIDVLAINFIVLKLCNLITWSWIWVLSPIWIYFIFYILILIGVKIKYRD